MIVKTKIIDRSASYAAKERNVIRQETDLP